MRDILKAKKRKKRKRVKRLLLSFLAYFFFLLLTSYFYPFKDTAKLGGIKVGQKLKNDVIAPYSFIIKKTQDELNEEKQRIIEETPPVFVRNTLVYQTVLAELDTLKISGDIKERCIKFLKRIYSGGVADTKDYIYGDSVLVEEDGKLVARSANFIIALQDVRNLAEKEASFAFPGDTLKQKIYISLITRIVQPDLVFDSLKTDSLRQEKICRIDTVREKIYKGEVIGKRGEIVTPEMIKRIDALRGARIKYFRGNLWKHAWLRVIIFAIILLFAFVYFYRLHPEYYFSISKITVFVIAYFIPLVVANFVFSENISFFVTLVPFAGLIVAIIMEEKSAFVFCFFLALILAIYGGESMSLFLYNFAVGVTAAMSAKIIRGRFDLYLSMLLTLAVGLVVSILMHYNLNDNLSGMRVTLEAYVVSILASYLLFIGVLPVLERVFKISTDFLLAELSNMNHPLLRELQEKAPGTMTHSLIVGNLAAQAAKAIGVNPLLARVAGYYHDIGKMKHPAYFIENQREGENPHDKLSPQMSVLILQDHVKDGVELAKQYRLPKEIIGVIETHHGTTLMKSFYNKAKSLNMRVKEEDFRYPGPRPRTKLEAICMIADSIEAAARGAKNKDEEKLKELIHNIIYERLKDGQFDEADITKKELKIIEETILPYVKSIFHPRVDYGESPTSSHK